MVDWAGLGAACLTPTALGQSWQLCFISSLCACALYFLTRKLASGGMKLSYGTTKWTNVLQSMKTQQEGKYKEQFVWLTCWLSSTNRMHYRASLMRYRYRACTRVPMIWFSKKLKNCLQRALGQEWSNHWRGVKPCCTLMSFLLHSLKEGLFRIVSHVSGILRPNDILSAV